MIEIKVAKKTDAAMLALLGRITYTESHGHFIDSKKDLLTYINDAFSIQKLSTELADSNTLFYLIYVDDLPVGYTKLVLHATHKNIHSKKACRLEKIYILNDFIPQKIGQPFLNFIKKKAKEMQFDAMWLTVYIKNERAIQFYKKNEFKNIGTYNFSVNGKGYENILFLKNISL